MGLATIVHYGPSIVGKYKFPPSLPAFTFLVSYNLGRSRGTYLTKTAAYSCFIWKYESTDPERRAQIKTSSQKPKREAEILKILDPIQGRIFHREYNSKLNLKSG